MSEQLLSMFTILGIPQTNDINIIKKQWKCLSLKFHPDRNEDKEAATRKIQDINNAYTFILEYISNLENPNSENSNVNYNDIYQDYADTCRQNFTDENVWTEINKFHLNNLLSNKKRVFYMVKHASMPNASQFNKDIAELFLGYKHKSNVKRLQETPSRTTSNNITKYTYKFEPTYKYTFEPTYFKHKIYK